MIYSPSTYEEVQEYFRQSSALSIHGTPVADDDKEHLILDRLNSVLLYEPEEMIINVQAGISIADLNIQLRAQGQWIPTLIADENLEQTVGAAIANDHYHPRAAALGALRTTIIGGTFVAADGTLFRSGSRVVKSVAGYDIHRAFCGSRGKFGAILDVTLKVQPLPEQFVWFLADSNTTHTEWYPTISEAPFFELAGFREDIEHDRTTLSTLEIATIDETEAHRSIREIIRMKATSLRTDTVMLQQLRARLDPKGVLS